MKSNIRFLTALALCCAIIISVPVSVNAVSLTCWYSNDEDIGSWSYSPQIRYEKIDQNDLFPFLTGLSHGSSIWNSALGLSTSVSSSYTAAPIVMYGGTIDQIRALNMFGVFSNDLLGRTIPTGYDYLGTLTYQGAVKYHYRLTSVIGCVISRSDLTHNAYVKTASHELGHALGWYGHPNTGSSSWVMAQGISTNTTLYEAEKMHLAQVY